MSETRWGYKHDSREFVAYHETAEGAAVLFADIMKRPTEEILPHVRKLPTNEAKLVTDERKAPGA